MRDGYVARWQGREYQASPDGDHVRIYQPEPADGFDEVRPGRYVRVVPAGEVEELGVRPDHLHLAGAAVHRARRA